MRCWKEAIFARCSEAKSFLPLDGNEGLAVYQTTPAEDTVIVCSVDIM